MPWWIVVWWLSSFGWRKFWIKRISVTCQQLQDYEVKRFSCSSGDTKPVPQGAWPAAEKFHDCLKNHLHSSVWLWKNCCVQRTRPSNFSCSCSWHRITGFSMKLPVCSHEGSLVPSQSWATWNLSHSHHMWGLSLWILRCWVRPVLSIKAFLYSLWQGVSGEQQKWVFWHLQWHSSNLSSFLSWI